MSSIPAKQLVQVNPSVLTVGGDALNMIALVLTSSTRVPIGTVPSFSSAQAVEDYFGAGSTEARLAAIYFAGFTGSSKLPGSILFAQYNASAVAGYMRGGDLGETTLAQIQAATGQFIISVDGTVETIASVDLSAASSFSNAAALLQTAINADAGANVTVTYDSVFNAFTIASTTTGSTSSISFASGSGTVDTVLKLTSATGAVRSPGAAAAVPATFMNSIVQITTDWATFMTSFDPDTTGQITVKEAFAAWKDTQNDRYGYVCWDLSAGPTATNPDTGSLGYILDNNSDSGTFLLNGDPAAWTEAAAVDTAAFVCGVAASINFEETNGRITFAFRNQAGLAATVTTETIADNLAGSPQAAARANGYNFYGTYGSASDTFTWLQRGFVTGPFSWFDSYINQIWLNNALQLALLNLMQNAKSIPYSTAGNTLIEAALADPIQAALTFGAFAPGAISASQIAQVNNDAGAQISDTLQTQGYYLQILPASSAVRAARTSPPCKFWYLDRGSVQAITLNSIALQ